jgi:hypothetical protein
VEKISSHLNYFFSGARDHETAPIYLFDVNDREELNSTYVFYGIEAEMEEKLKVKKLSAFDFFSICMQALTFEVKNCFFSISVRCFFANVFRLQI